MRWLQSPAPERTVGLGWCSEGALQEGHVVDLAQAAPLCTLGTLWVEGSF